MINSHPFDPTGYPAPENICFRCWQSSQAHTYLYADFENRQGFIIQSSPNYCNIVIRLDPT